MINRIANYQKFFSTKKSKSTKGSVVGIIQAASTDNLDKNYQKFKVMVEECVDRGADMVCLPEYFAYN